MHSARSKLSLKRKKSDLKTRERVTIPTGIEHTTINVSSHTQSKPKLAPFNDPSKLSLVVNKVDLSHHTPKRHSSPSDVSVVSAVCTELEGIPEAEDESTTPDTELERDLTVCMYIHINC